MFGHLAPTDRAHAVTRSLLGYGLLAGPFYVITGLAQALAHPGFDLARHDLSLLSAGPLGWIQIADFVLSGLMTIIAAVGMRRALAEHGDSGAGPWLVTAYGLGVGLAGVFVADPMDGYPPGTPDGPPAVSTWHGLGHLVAGGVGFLALVAACLVTARRFARQGRRGWAGYCAASGLLFLAAFAGVASGSDSPTIVLGFWAGVVIAWAWIAAYSLHLYRSVPAPCHDPTTGTEHPAVPTSTT